MQSCCATGFKWEGTPTGREDTIDNHPVYISGDSKDRAILFNHDAFGWQLNNARLLADHFAKEVGATVYLPDLLVLFGDLQPGARHADSCVASTAMPSAKTTS